MNCMISEKLKLRVKNIQNCPICMDVDRCMAFIIL